ncbi:hypothetical protein ACFS3C_01930 [Azotobacter vinelandii]
MLLTFLQGLSPWHWLGLGILLLILEVFDAGGYLLWMALVATGLAVLLQVLPDFFPGSCNCCCSSACRRCCCCSGNAGASICWTADRAGRVRSRRRGTRIARR